MRITQAPPGAGDEEHLRELVLSDDNWSRCTMTSTNHTDFVPSAASAGVESVLAITGAGA